MVFFLILGGCFLEGKAGMNGGEIGMAMDRRTRSWEGTLRCEVAMIGDYSPGKECRDFVCDA